MNSAELSDAICAVFVNFGKPRPEPYLLGQWVAEFMRIPASVRASVLDAAMRESRLPTLGRIGELAANRAPTAKQGSWRGKYSQAALELYDSFRVGERVEIKHRHRTADAPDGIWVWCDGTISGDSGCKLVTVELPNRAGTAMAFLAERCADSPPSVRRPPVRDFVEPQREATLPDGRMVRESYDATNPDSLPF